MRIDGRPNEIEDALRHMHNGAWFGWSDSKNKVYANLIIHDGSKSKPTESAVNAKLVELQDAWDLENDSYRSKRRDQDCFSTPSFPNFTSKCISQLCRKRCRNIKFKIICRI